jgi:single-strand DNA-binding protein
MKNSDPVCNMRIATSESWVKDGERQSRTEWHNVAVFGRQAESCAKYLEKGRRVFVQGQIQTRKWKDREGNERYTTEIKVSGPLSTVQFLDSVASEQGERPRKQATRPQPQPQDVDIPF